MAFASVFTGSVYGGALLETLNADPSAAARLTSGSLITTEYVAANDLVLFIVKRQTHVTWRDHYLDVLKGVPRGNFALLLGHTQSDSALDSTL